MLELPLPLLLNDGARKSPELLNRAISSEPREAPLPPPFLSSCPPPRTRTRPEYGALPSRVSDPVTTRSPAPPAGGKTQSPSINVITGADSVPKLEGGLA